MDDTRKIQQIQENIAYLRILFPFDSFLITKNAIVLMEPKLLLEGNNKTGYKFINDTVVVGKIHRKIGVREDGAPTNQRLDKIQRLTISILQDIGIINRDLDIYLIAPVAIYTEQCVLRENE